MEQGIWTIQSNRPLTGAVYEMTLTGTGEAPQPGQFVNIALPGRYLRRPISVCDGEKNRLTLVYKVVGHGTEDMSKLCAGDELDILTGLGNGYDIACAGDKPLLIGGGVGVPPLYLLAKKLLEIGKTPTVILGFNTQSEIFYEERFRALGCQVAVTTVDGSYGLGGFVTDALPEGYTHVYTCGPLPMLKAVYTKTDTDGQYSFEERMGCGFGACMGCSQKTTTGYKRVCKDGPVFRKGEILWDD